MKERKLMLLIICLLVINSIGMRLTSGEEYLQWNLQQIGVDDLWDHTTGDSVIVAIIDTGLNQQHPELDGKLWVNEKETDNNNVDDDKNGYIDDLHGWNFKDNNNNLNDDSRVSHGTHVAGTLVGNTIGIAPSTKIMILKVFGYTGEGGYESIAESIVYATNNGADIISMSLGGKEDNSQIRAAVEYASEKGVILIAAAGNQVTIVDYPARYDEVIAVGSVNHLGKRSYFSNFGEELELMAPGENINSSSRVGKGIGAIMSINGKNYNSIPFTNTKITVDYITRMLIDGGNGTDIGPQSKDKITLINSEENYSKIAQNVESYGGYGMIIYGGKGGVIMDETEIYADIVALSISKETGEEIKKLISNTTEVEVRTHATDYMRNSGTSMATPHVSGFAALIISYKKAEGMNYDAKSIREILRNGASKEGSLRDNMYGYGFVRGHEIETLLLDKTPPVIEIYEISKEESLYGKLDVEIGVRAKDNNKMSDVLYGQEGSSIEIIRNSEKDEIIEFTFGIELLSEERKVKIIINATDMATNDYSVVYEYDREGGLIIYEGNDDTNEAKNLTYFVIDLWYIVPVSIIIIINHLNKKRK